MKLHTFMRPAFVIFYATGLLLCTPLPAAEYIKGTWQEHHAFSPAVITQGGKIVWLAGEGGIVAAEPSQKGETLDINEIEIATDFDEQVHNTFRRLDATLKRAGGSLQDMVTMTVFIKDMRHGERFVKLRKEYFPENAPASALITVTGFAVPEMLLEIQGIAVIGED